MGNDDKIVRFPKKDETPEVVPTLFLRYSPKDSVQKECLKKLVEEMKKIPAVHEQAVQEISQFASSIAYKLDEYMQDMQNESDPEQEAFLKNELFIALFGYVAHVAMYVLKAPPNIPKDFYIFFQEWAATLLENPSLHLDEDDGFGERIRYFQ